MPKLSNQTINEYVDDSELVFEECDTIAYSWEGFYGLDSHEWLPYWIEYMPYKQRYAYLTETQHQFLDYEPEMLRVDYNWKEWDCKYDGIERSVERRIDSGVNESPA